MRGLLASETHTAAAAIAVLGHALHQPGHPMAHACCAAGIALVAICHGRNRVKAKLGDADEPNYPLIALRWAIGKLFLKDKQ